MTNKHVLFIIENRSVPYDYRVWREALAAKEWGYDVSIISPKDDQATLAYEKIDGIDVYRHPVPLEAEGKLGFIGEYANALFRELLLSIKIYLRKPFHIIHAANPPDTIFLIALLFKIFGAKYVFDHHDICPENYLAKFGERGLLYRASVILERLTFAVASIVISTNESYRNIAMGRGKKNGEDVFVVRNGPDLSETIHMTPNETLKREFDYLVAYVGAIGKQDDIDVLLRAVEYIIYRMELRNIKFVIVGTGAHWKEMVELSRELKLTDYVSFTGFIPYKELYEILATADVCVNPEYKNSFTDKSTMVKIMDYMTFGKPIVQFDVTEGRVTARDASLYVQNNSEIEFAQAIVGLLNDSEKRKTMGEFGRRRLEESLAWDKQKIQLKRAYDHLEMNWGRSSNRRIKAQAAKGS